MVFRAEGGLPVGVYLKCRRSFGVDGVRSLLFLWLFCCFGFLGLFCFVFCLPFWVRCKIPMGGAGESTTCFAFEARLDSSNCHT